MAIFPSRAVDIIYTYQPTGDGAMMKVSYSSISAYQKCPLSYRFQYVDCEPGAPSAALSFGSSLHEALRWFYDLPTPDPYSCERLVDYLDNCWISEGYSSPEEEARYFFQARSTLKLFYRNNISDFRLPAALEQRFRVDLGFCELSGQIDRLDKDPDGGFEIIDYKTNRRLPPANRLYEDLQLPIYHIAARKLWEVSAEKVTFYYLIMNHRHSMSISPERIDSALAEVRSVVSAIESEAFEARRNNLCPWCDYIGVCPEWKGKPAPAKKTRTSAPGLDIGEAVDELLTASDQVSSKLARIEALKGIIASYIAERGLERVGGARCVAYIDDEGCLAWEEADAWYAH